MSHFAFWKIASTSLIFGAAAAALVACGGADAGSIDNEGNTSDELQGSGSAPGTTAAPPVTPPKPSPVPAPGPVPPNPEPPICVIKELSSPVANPVAGQCQTAAAWEAEGRAFCASLHFRDEGVSLGPICDPTAGGSDPSASPVRLPKYLSARVECCNGLPSTSPVPAAPSAASQL